VIRNIIFDWSGTLVDDLPAVLKASNFVLTQAGKPEMSLEQFRAEFSLPFTKFYDRHTPDVPMPQLEDWFHAEFKRRAGLPSWNCRTRAISGILPREKNSARFC
jgi:phosphoglycolate phosphatase